MKTALRAVMTLKVHYLLFVLACVGLVGVAIEARLMADDIASIADGAMQQLGVMVLVASGG